MSFRADLEGECVRSLPIRTAIAIPSTTLVRAAIALMKRHSLGCAVLVDCGDRPVGIFTEQSIISVLVHRASLDGCTVKQFADDRFVVVKEQDPIIRVWDSVRSGQTRFICVTDEYGKTVGITGQRGVSEYVADCFPAEVAVQRLGGTPWMRNREGA